jgi:hypothetical protein
MIFLLATLLRLKRHSTFMIFFYTVAFILLFVLGTMMARTTLIGTILAFILLVWPASVGRAAVSKNVFRFGGSFVLILLLLGFMIFFLSAESRELLSNATEFAFEIFINYAKGEGISSASTDELKDMFIWPQELRTYLIGDGRFVNPQDPVRYYMGTDVGYLRMLYYFGIPGIILFLIIQLVPVVVCLKIYRSNAILVRFFICSFFFLIVLNVKGFTDLFYMNILFYYIARHKALNQNYQTII